MSILLNGNLFELKSEQDGVSCFTSRSERIQLTQNITLEQINPKNNIVKQTYPNVYYQPKLTKNPTLTLYFFLRRLINYLHLKLSFDFHLLTKNNRNKKQLNIPDFLIKLLVVLKSFSQKRNAIKEHLKQNPTAHPNTGTIMNTNLNSKKFSIIQNLLFNYHLFEIGNGWIIETFNQNGKLLIKNIYFIKPHNNILNYNIKIMHNLNQILNDIPKYFNINQSYYQQFSQAVFHLNQYYPEYHL